MIYTFKCRVGHRRSIAASMAEGPPKIVVCYSCGEQMDRDWKSDTPMLDTSKCRDADHIPEQHRVQRSSSPRSEEAEEAKFHSHIQERRKQLRDGNRGSIRQTHAVPADLFYGKIRQTGDKSYWSDPSNLAKHKSCKVDQ